MRSSASSIVKQLQLLRSRTGAVAEGAAGGGGGGTGSGLPRPTGNSPASASEVVLSSSPPAPHRPVFVHVNQVVYQLHSPSAQTARSHSPSRAHRFPWWVFLLGTSVGGLAASTYDRVYAREIVPGDGEAGPRSTLPSLHWGQFQGLGIAKAADALLPGMLSLPEVDTSDLKSTGPGPTMHRYTISEAAACAAPAVVHLTLTDDKKPNSYLPRRYSGSGFLYQSDGYIMTNAHVVLGAIEDKSATLLVHLQDGRTFEGKVVRFDMLSDLAVVKVNPPSPLPAVRLGSSKACRVGEWVIAVGSPLLLKHSVTAGIISCVERKSSELGLGSTHMDFIQTDAAVNQGNSGGPLINLDGEVIGINNMKAVAADGVSFAIPIDTAKSIVEELFTNGRVVRPFIGISMLQVDVSNIRALQDKAPGFPSITQGIVVTTITPDSPAGRAGMKADDVIVSVAGQREPSAETLRAALRSSIGRAVEVEVLRRTPTGDRFETVTLTLVPVEAAMWHTPLEPGP